MNKQPHFTTPSVINGLPLIKAGGVDRTPNCTPSGVQVRFGEGAFLYKRALTLVHSFFAQFLSRTGVDSTTSRHILLGKLECQTLLGNKRVISIPYYSSEPFNASNAQMNQLGLALFSLFQHAPLVNGSIKREKRLVFHPNYVGNENGYVLVKDSGSPGSVQPKGSAPGGTSGVEVRLIKLHYPYLDSSILAQYVAMNRNKYNFTRMHKRIFKKAESLRLPSTGTKRESVLPFDALPGHTTGLKMELAGRLTTQRSIPRKTVSNKHTGSFHVQHGTKTSQVTNHSQYGSKNKLGAYTMKV